MPDPTTNTNTPPIDDVNVRNDLPPPSNEYIVSPPIDTLPLSEWDTFYTASTIVLYLPAYKQIIFVKSSTGSATQQIYLFDIPTRSWVRGNDQFADSTSYSNSVIDSNGNTVILEDSTNVRKWDDAATPSGPHDMQIQWRDEVFNQIGVKKKIYSVVVTYKSSVSNTANVKFYYAMDGDRQFTTFATASMVTATEWNHAIFEPGTPVMGESIQFYLAAMDGTFEIDDLSIEYRVLPYARVP